MFKTVRGKLLFYIIFPVLLINLAFTIFIGTFLESKLKSNIIHEMNINKSFAVNTMEQGIILKEPVGASLNKISKVTNCYVALANREDEITDFIKEPLKKEDIEIILKESNRTDSVITFNKFKNVYCITYNYPIYVDSKFYGNLIVQKDYNNIYQDMIKTITIIIMGQATVVLTIVAIIYLVVNKVTNPIKVLSDSMENLKDSMEEEDVLIHSTDEIGALANTYNIMKNELRIQMKEIIGEKEKVEKLQKSSREFFNNATHELKTPITAISLYSQLLRDNSIKELEEDFIYRATDRIVLESNKMKELVEKLLEVSKGQVYLNKTKINFEFSELLNEIIEDFDLRLSKKSLKLNKRIDKVNCYGVLEDIEQIVVNLIDNSVKYSVGNEIDISLYQNEGNVVFEISNQCLDIPEDIKDKLLEPFVKYNQQEDVSKEVSSSGLGLYLCSELAKENNGELSYKIRNNYISFILKIGK